MLNQSSKNSKKLILRGKVNNWYKDGIGYIDIVIRFKGDDVKNLVINTDILFNCYSTLKIKCKYKEDYRFAEDLFTELITKIDDVVNCMSNTSIGNVYKAAYYGASTIVDSSESREKFRANINRAIIYNITSINIDVFEYRRLVQGNIDRFLSEHKLETCFGDTAIRKFAEANKKVPHGDLRRAYVFMLASLGDADKRFKGLTASRLFYKQLFDVSNLKMYEGYKFD